MKKIQTVKDANKISISLRELSKSARRELEKGLSEILTLYASKDKAKQALYFSAAQELFIELTNKYGTAAQVIALEALEAQSIPVKSVKSIYETMNAAAITEKAIQSPNGGTSYLLGALDQTVKRGYRDTIFSNAPTWARVPSGAYTCPWCVMLASRGFVYNTEESAGGTKQWHAYCDCALIPSNSNNPKLDGYDPDELYTKYRNGEGIGERPRVGKNELIEQAKIALDVKGNEI